MRWHAVPLQAPTRFTGEIAAVPVTLLSRDEDALHASTIRSQPRPHVAAARRTFPSKAAPPRVSAPPAKLPDHRRPLIASPNETIRLSATVVVTSHTTSDSRVLTPRSDEPQASVLDETNKFLVCAGRAMSAESPRSNNDDESAVGNPTATTTSTAQSNIGTSGMSSAQLAETPRSTQRALQRSDSELELIISELREKIALQQRSQSPQTDDDGRSHQHSRKHLKNPVEKMSLAPSTSSTSVQLRRQASASQVHATRLVREGSATMVTPVVLANSASRAALANHNSGGNIQTTTLETGESYVVSSQQQHLEPAEGFRIRAYATGNDTAPNPAFTSSTSLGQNIPTSLPSPRRVTTTSHTTPETVAIHASLLRPSKPRARTLVDLDLELDRLHGPDGDDCCGDGVLSPVGPWAMDQDFSGALASARSTASLGTNASVSELVLGSAPESAAELSPRSRLLWLSDCCGDDAWATPSDRVMAMLRPGSHPQRELSRRPASAAELRRRQKKSKVTRATSAKTTMPRRASGDSCGTQDAASRQSVAKAPPRVAQRPRSGSGSSSSTGSSSWSSSTTSGRMVLAQRASFRA